MRWPTPMGWAEALAVIEAWADGEVFGVDLGSAFDDDARRVFDAYYDVVENDHPIDYEGGLRAARAVARALAELPEYDGRTFGGGA
jgi:hypothetical protein